MKILITAGNTQSPVDRVRCITNIFSGRTGARIAAEAASRGHEVTFITSHPETLGTFDTMEILPYRTFEELEAYLAQAIVHGGFDAIIHAAAVNDYHVVGTFVKRGDEFVDVSAGKVSISELHPKFCKARILEDKGVISGAFLRRLGQR